MGVAAASDATVAVGVVGGIVAATTAVVGMGVEAAPGVTVAVGDAAAAATAVTVGVLVDTSTAARSSPSLPPLKTPAAKAPPMPTAIATTISPIDMGRTGKRRILSQRGRLSTCRMAAGYAPGEHDNQSGLRYIRESDSHGWTQAYFPGYGWIDFEPTPNWPGLDHQPLPVGAEGTEPSISEDLLDLEFLDTPVDPFEMEGAEGFLELTAGESTFDVTGLVVRLAIAIGSLGFAWLVWTRIWNLGLGNASPAERLYTKMNRMGAMAGIRRPAHQTPNEYATALGHALPAVATGARNIGWAFAGARYGNGRPDPAELSALDQAWKSIRGKLAIRAFRRLVPIRGRG